MVRKVRRAKTNSKKLRERADYCRRLAVGVGHPQFTIRLGTLADEYEAMAIEVDAEALEPICPRWKAQMNCTPDNSITTQTEIGSFLFRSSLVSSHERHGLSLRKGDARPDVSIPVRQTTVWPGAALLSIEDHYEAALQELLDKKQKGQPIAKMAPRTRAKVVNLMDANGPPKV